MKSIFFATIAFAFAVSTGCYKYEVQYEGPYNDNQQTGSTQINYEIMTVEDGKIRLYTRNLSQVKTLDNLPPGIERASVNFAHDRIAYKVAGQHVAIADTSGALIEWVPNSASASWFDWHANNQTLYLLNGNTLTFWGPNLTVAATNLAALFPAGSSDRTVSCAMVTGDGSIVAACHYYGGFSVGYQSRLSILSPSGDAWHQLIGSSALVNWLRGDRDDRRVLCGTLINGSSSDLLEIDLSARTVSQTGSAPFAAPGLSDEQTAFWQYNELSVYFQPFIDPVTLSTGTASFKALDW